MRFARFNVGGVPTYGVLHTNGNLYDLPRMLTASGSQTETPATLLDAALGGARLADAFAAVVQELTAAGTLDRFVLPQNDLLAPFPRPNRILAIGRNYSEHAQELGNTVGEEPIVFLKASTSVIGPEAPIVIPPWAGRVDYEAELLVVLGKGGKDISEEQALDLVAGYTVFNDVTARDIQKAAQAKKHPWFLGKSLDTFGPMGPFLVTRDEVPDPQNLRVSLTVNGETRQDGNTSAMVFQIPYLISYLSRWFALEPGDVIATGTPAGVGPIVPGDIVEATVEGIGSLRNPVVAGPPADSPGGAR